MITQYSQQKVRLHATEWIIQSDMKVTRIQKTHPSVGRFVIANFAGHKGCAVVTQKLQVRKSIRTEDTCGL